MDSKCSASVVQVHTVITTRLLDSNKAKLLPVFWVLTAKSNYPFFTYMQLSLLHTIKPIHTIKLMHYTAPIGAPKVHEFCFGIQALQGNMKVLRRSFKQQMIKA